MKYSTITRINLLFLGFFLTLASSISAQEAYEGFSFYSSGKNASLYNHEKELVHTWESQYTSAGAAHLMRDSSVLFSGRNSNGWSGGKLTGGQFQIITWDGEVIWDFNYASTEYCPHHNFEIMYYTDDQDEVPNVMAACYEKISGASRLPDKLVEIKPTGETTGEIVWEWHAWDHRTDDPDNHPELLEAPSDRQMGDWNHVNNVSYNRELDQLVVDMKSFDEFIIIDHSTTTEEAAGSTGGDYGKGGTLLYRWGQASNYGISGSDYIEGFHGGKWVPYVFPGTNIEMPGAGNVLIYHNDKREVNEIILPGVGDGIYPRNQGEAFGPSSPTWTYDNSTFSQHEGSVQRLPNGNTFIYDAGRSMYEVTPGGDIIWTLLGGGNQARKYAYSYLEQSTYVKDQSSSDHRDVAVRIYSHPVTRTIHISFTNARNNAEISIFSLNGKKVFSRMVTGDHFSWQAKNHSNGAYIVKVREGKNIFSKYVNVIQ